MIEENKEMKTEERKQKDNLESGDRRLVISMEADLALSEIISDVNLEAIAGKASRYDVANFIILWFKNNAPKDAIDDIRRQSATVLSMLETLEKSYKKTGELPIELQRALEGHFFGDLGKNQKKCKTLKQKYITDILKESGKA